MNKKNKLNEKFIEGNEVKILEFELDDGSKAYHLALNIQKVKEVVEFNELDPLPNKFNPFIGIYNLRKIPVPVLDLLKIFNTNTHKHEYSKQDRIIICDFQKMLVGIIVSKTKHVMTYDNNIVQPQPAAIVSSQKHYFNGLIQHENYTCNLLDIEFILDSLQVNLGSKTEATKSNKLTGKTVLVAEDSKFFQKKIDILLKKLGFSNVIIADDGKEAYEILKGRNFDVDLIFTDIEMPNMNGIGFVRKIKENEIGATLPVIFNTSLSNPTLRDDIINNNLGNLIVKFDEVEILKEIEKIF